MLMLIAQRCYCTRLTVTQSSELRHHPRVRLLKRDLSYTMRGVRFRTESCMPDTRLSTHAKADNEVVPAAACSVVLLLGSPTLSVRPNRYLPRLTALLPVTAHKEM